MDAVTLTPGTRVQFQTQKPGHVPEFTDLPDGTFTMTAAPIVTVTGVIAGRVGMERLGNAGVRVDLDGEHAGHVAHIRTVHDVTVLAVA